MHLMSKNPRLFEENIKAIKLGKEVSFRVNGWTMLPFYRHYETIVTVRKDSYDVGDVVLYIDGKLCLHRIISKDHYGFKLQGDGQYHYSSKISQEAIIGRVIKFMCQGEEFDTSKKATQRKAKLWLGLKKLPGSRLYISQLRRHLSSTSVSVNPKTIKVSKSERHKY